MDSAAQFKVSESERALMIAVLKQAFEDLQHVRWDFAWQELIEFFFGPYDGPLSFNTICESLDLDHAALREAAAAYSLGGRVFVGDSWWSKDIEE